MKTYIFCKTDLRESQMKTFVYHCVLEGIGLFVRNPGVRNGNDPTQLLWPLTVLYHDNDVYVALLWNHYLNRLLS